MKTRFQTQMQNEVKRLLAIMAGQEVDGVRLGMPGVSMEEVRQMVIERHRLMQGQQD